MSASTYMKLSGPHIPKRLEEALFQIEHSGTSDVDKALARKIAEEEIEKYRRERRKESKAKRSNQV